MKPIQTNDRGAAVEDIQRRLLMLGYELGPTGVDGVFWEDTCAAVAAFQAACGIEPNGVVGSLTWSTLVDMSFGLGDRMLYLRLPHFHGADVAQLQRALNSLGFACGAGVGAVDGIFGAFTERAVAEFQENSGLDADGLVGPDTFRSLFALRHMWDDKGGAAHSAARGAARERDKALQKWRFVFEVEDYGSAGAGVPELRRLVRHANNLVEAICGSEKSASAGAAELEVVRVMLRTCAADVYPASGDSRLAINYHSDHRQFARRISTERRGDKPTHLVIVLPAEVLVANASPSLQHTASLLLDALCLAFMHPTL